MKKTLFMMTFVFGLGSIVLAQKAKHYTQPPENVLHAFEKRHQGIKAKWEKENGSFEAGFTEGKKEMSEVYEPNGTLVETEQEIDISELPDNVAQHVTKYNMGKMKEAAKITYADGRVEYEVEVKKGDAMFDKNGVFIKISKD